MRPAFDDQEINALLGDAPACDSVPLSLTRQPVHTLYGGAHRFNAALTSKSSSLALTALNKHGRDADTFGEALGIASHIREIVWTRVAEKLAREAIEDFRIDFEDGYGVRLDEEEDRHAEASAIETNKAAQAGALPPFSGIRIKPMSPGSARRALRTLGIYLGTVTNIPPHFVVTLPKISSTAEVDILIRAIVQLEAKFHHPRISVELMMETPEAILDPRALVSSAQGRCRGAHFGPFDWTASLGILGHDQSLHHPACIHARTEVQIALAGSGVTLADGPTPVLPLGDDTAKIHSAWKLHYDNVRRSMYMGYFQGWDLHPAQLPSRYAAVYAHFLEQLDDMSERLRNFVAQFGQATRIGGAFDDAATGRGLVNFFLRAVDCGALTAEEAEQRAGLSLEAMRAGRFTP